MSKSPVKKKKTPSLPGKGILAICFALIVILVLIFAIRSLESALEQPAVPSETLPSESTEPPLPANPYGPDDFVPDENGYLTCTAGSAMLGIDVSDHQHEIDWNAVAQAGIEFAIIRIGYRGYTKGEIFSDRMAQQNLQGAKAAGLKTGAYFYSQAISPEEAAQEAEFCVAFLNDYELDLPLVYDWEYVSEDARTGSMDPDTLTQCVQAFCRTVQEAGLEPMIYFNPHLAENLFQLTQLDEYPFWLALYSDTMDYPHRVEMWQYSCTGSVPGISTQVDMNLLFTDG